MTQKIGLLFTLFLFAVSAPSFAADNKQPDLKVKIDGNLPSVTVMHKGKPLVIQRNQNTKNTITEDFALTSRACPPFCVQPMTILPGVNTIGELELLEFLKRQSAGDKKLLIIDSRTPDWVAKGTIPGAVNIPWTELFRGAAGYEPFAVEGLLTLRFGAAVDQGIWDFSNAKELVMFCNGPWCGQSPTNIRTLVSMGYPAHKIHWYRGGMQAWHSLGLTTVKP